MEREEIEVERKLRNRDVRVGSFNCVCHFDTIRRSSRRKIAVFSVCKAAILEVRLPGPSRVCVCMDDIDVVEPLCRGCRCLSDRSLSSHM
jgi:hypothetical protein